MTIILMVVNYVGGAIMRDCYKWFDLCKVKLVNYIPTGSVYIVPDGRFADLNASGYRTHGAVDEQLRAIGYPVDPTELYHLYPVEFMNCVRVNDGKNFSFEVVVDLPANKITSDQLDSIERYIDALPCNEVTVGSVVKNAFMTYDLNEVSAYAIRKKILGFYMSGVLHENSESVENIE